MSGAMHAWSSATLANTASGLVGSDGITYCSMSCEHTQGATRKKHDRVRSGLQGKVGLVSLGCHSSSWRPHHQQYQHETIMMDKRRPDPAEIISLK